MIAFYIQGVRRLALQEYGDVVNVTETHGHMRTSTSWTTAQTRVNGDTKADAALISIRER